ncbi:MAG: PIN domain-containing protein, partial [Spirochaetales bacterium]|nr:PIN domain-containing protein [Spirochaetales bacterium]
MNVVLDTNIIVSAALSPGRNASDILLAAITGRFNLYYDYRISEEYYKVMHYPKFGFEEWEIDAILDPLLKHGIPIHAETIQGIQFTDESDRKFYEVAKTIGA